MSAISKFLGRFAESGTWRDTNGNSGELGGEISISVDAQRVFFSIDDGHTMIAGLSADPSSPMKFEGSGGGATSAGTVYVGRNSLILEYTADVAGREEHNLDVWTLSGSDLQRAGIIRQSERTIWFEAEMRKSG